MNKHTPSPWEMFSHKHESIIVVSSLRSDVAWIRNEYAGLRDTARSREEDEANARLMAAAPELLEALQDVLKRIENSDEWWMDNPDRGGFDAEMIKAIIAKATGESP